MKKILYSLIVLLSGLIFNSCSTDEQQNDSKGLVEFAYNTITLSEDHLEKINNLHVLWQNLLNKWLT